MESIQKNKSVVILFMMYILHQCMVSLHPIICMLLILLTRAFGRWIAVVLNIAMSRPGEYIMTNLEIFKAIRTMGMAVSLNNGEWRVDYRKGDSRRSLDSCYYTDDKQDALQTAEVMSRWNR
jgi:hypothetical protein